SCGLPADVEADRETPLSHSFCKHVVVEDAALIVPNSTADPRVADNPAIADLGVAAYLGVPIHDASGEVLGSFCVIHDTPRAWSEDDLTTLRDLSKVVEAELVLRATVANRDLVLSEMTHRIKNLCTVVIGMIRLDKHRADTAAELSERLTRRIMALSSAHHLIAPVVAAGAVRSPTTSLATVVEQILSPYVLDGHAGFDGPDTTLGERAAVYLALALHEITTNAVKYGALSVPEGSATLTWALTDEALRLTWRETGHLWDMSDPSDMGFGSKLLDLSIRGNLGGTLENRREETTFEIAITVPQASLGS
ncbi:MAG: GAF domain-containing protein, partial [Pseudomonadota bacterium]